MKDQFFIPAAGISILLCFLFQPVLRAQPTGSVFKDTHETRAVVLKPGSIPVHPVKAKKDSLQGKTQPQNEKIIHFSTCGTVYGEKKPDYWWYRAFLSCSCCF
jgi:hypothetical protein